MIYATINKKDAMVEFHDCPEKYNNLDVLDFLQKQVYYPEIVITIKVRL